MGFVGFDSIMFFLHVLHVYTPCLYIMLCFVLWRAYHVYDKISFRCFVCVCVVFFFFFWTPLSTKIVGIIMFFFFFETSNDYVFSHIAPCMFSCPSLHTFTYDAHTHTPF